MADPHHTPGHATGTTHDFAREADNPGTLIAVFVAIAGLALANVGLSTVGLGKFALPIQMAIACVQAGIVAYYFMHLRQGDRVVILTALSSLFWMGILFFLFLSDYATRHRVMGG